MTKRRNAWPVANQLQESPPQSLIIIAGSSRRVFSIQIKIRFISVLIWDDVIYSNIAIHSLMDLRSNLLILLSPLWGEDGKQVGVLVEPGLFVIDIV